MKNTEFVTVLQGKAVRETAVRLINGTWKIERESLNRYRVYEAPVNHVPESTMVINRRSFVLLDKEIYRLQARENPLASGIEKALDADSLEFTIRKSAVDKMPVKLIARTFSIAKVAIENVLIKADNYIIRFTLIPTISERDLSQKELEVAEIFIQANTNAGNQVTPETPALPAPEETAQVDTTAKVIPAK